MSPTVPELLFFVCMAIALVSWLALFFLPGKRAVNWWLCGVITPSIFAVIYAYLLVAYWDQPPGQSFLYTYITRFGSLPGVAKMFRDQGLLLVGWLDILALDLVGGAWQARRAQKTGMPRFALTVCLLVTYANAPLGMALYYIVDASRGTLGKAGD